MASAAATAVAAISATSGEDLERFVDAGAISGLTRGLTSGLREEAADCAAALAVLARLPSAHPHLLRSGACDVLLRCAGSRVCIAVPVITGVPLPDSSPTDPDRNCLNELW